MTDYLITLAGVRAEMLQSGVPNDRMFPSTSQVSQIVSLDF